ncbi:MAG: hypothetical protein MAG795_00396 [Candidatus Woesearchaeota archaeon]|nr:hypothetical protein [Candidatus Woesearchaeota archaeon]
MEKDIGEIELTESTSIKVRIDEYDGKPGLTIRKFITSERYTGFTKQGVRVPAEKWKDFKKLIDQADSELE